VALDPSIASTYLIERFEKTGELLTTHTYDSRGMQTAIKVERWAWVQRSSHLKVRTNLATAWDGINFAIDGGGAVKANGDGRGISDILAQWVLVEQIDTDFDVDDLGFIHGEFTTTQQWTHRKGSGSGKQFLYADGIESGDSQDVFVPVITERISYIEEGESVTAVTVTIDIDGNQTVESDDLDGYLPAAEQDLSIVAQTDDGVAASRLDSEPIVAECHSPALLTSKMPWVMQESSQWAESVSELEALCNAFLERRSALEVNVALVGNFVVTPLTLVHLTHLDEGFDGNVWIEEIGEAQSAPGGLILTPVKGIHIVI